MYEKLFENNDAVIVFGSSNRFYFTGLETSFGCVLIMPDRKFFYTDFRYELAARNIREGYELVITTPEKLYELIDDRLREAGAVNVGFDDNYVTVAGFKEIKKQLKDYTFHSVANEIAELRAVKSDIEIEHIKKAQSITEKALSAVLSLLKPGVTEKDISAELTYRFLKFGADGLAFDNIVAFGENSSDCHHIAGDRKLEKGDVILFDIGAKANGYCSDMTRTFYYKEVSEEHRKIYDIVRSANEKAISMIRPGVPLCELDGAARDLITDAGYGEYFTHRLGHFIGLAEHEYGDVSSANNWKAEPGMIFSIEPGIYLSGDTGVRVEDLVLVTEDGCEVLNHYSKDLEVIG